MFGDWFMRAAVNNGLPLNTVVSSANFLASLDRRPELYRGSILAATVPDAGSPVARALLKHVQAGGQVLLYGPLDRAGGDLLGTLNVRLAEPISGELGVDVRACADRLSAGAYPSRMLHRETMSAGACREVLAEPGDRHTQVLAAVSKDKAERVAALVRRPPGCGGAWAWVRGTNSSSYRGGHLLTPDDPKQWFQGDLLMRFAAAALGQRVGVSKCRPEQRNPVVAVARHNNGFFFSGYTPDLTVELRLRFPQGAPLLTGLETELVDGDATYRMPRAWHRECRAFVAQRQGVIACTEQISGQIGIKRRLQLTGLKDATVCFYPESGSGNRVLMQPDPKYPFVESPELETKVVDDHNGHRLTAEHLNGTLLISW